MASLGQIVLYHLDTGTDRPAIVMKVNGDTTCDLHIFVDPATDNADWNIDPNALPPTLIKVERSVASGAGVGQFT